jgi:hypothetical protein
MEVMGYPIPFIKWLRTMYSVTQMSNLNGTEVAGTFSNFHSFRQGCPCPSLLSILNHFLLDFPLFSMVSIYLVPKSLSEMVDDVPIFVSSDSDIIMQERSLTNFAIVPRQG